MLNFRGKSPIFQMQVVPIVVFTRFFFFFLWTLVRTQTLSQTKNMESCHHRSKYPEEPEWTLITSLPLPHSNALNKMKANRAYLVIYFLDLQPTVKIISKEAILPLFSLSLFLSLPGFQTVPLLVGRVRLAQKKIWVFFFSLYVATRFGDNQAVVVILPRHITPSHRDR